MARKIQRILLVEPDGVLAEVTAFRLELLGYAVEIVSNGDDARRYAAEQQPNLIITNLMLGESLATSLIETLGSQAETSDIPVMVMSIDADLDRVTQMHQAGAADFLVVPFQPEVLQEKVARLMSRPQPSTTDRARSTV
jgi:DNA-binding response OmpR family regulator